MQLYRISPQFVNVTGNFLNTSVLEVFPNVEGIGTTKTPYQSPIVGLGSPVNNRQGASLNADVSFGQLKLNGGIGIFAEIDTSMLHCHIYHNVNSRRFRESMCLHKTGGHIMPSTRPIEEFLKT